MTETATTFAAALDDAFDRAAASFRHPHTFQVNDELTWTTRHDGDVAVRVMCRYPDGYVGVVVTEFDHADQRRYRSGNMHTVHCDNLS